MKEIQLTQGKTAQVSDHRFDELNRHKWQAAKIKQTFYAVRKADHRTIYMHRVIMGVTDPAIKVDHRDGNGLNCQDYNLRVCTHTENNRNRRNNKKSSTGFVGVVPDKKKFRARITYQGEDITIGRFDSAIEAAHARDAVAKRLHGDFAVLNFPSPSIAAA